MTNQPLISIIIPTYNRQAMLEETLNSVLHQDYPAIEIIIIDDCSPDHTQEYLQQLNLPNLQYFRNTQNQGAGYARKLGYQQSQGQYLIFMDDDDYYIDPQFFTKAITIFNANPTLAFVAGNAKIKYQTTQTYQYTPLNVQGKIHNWDYLSHFQTQYQKPYSTFTTIFNKTILDQVNFNELQMVNDSSIYLRALLGGDAYILPDVIGVYRIHQKNITSNLKPDFMIANLQEKAIIANRMRQYDITINPKQWWYSQALLTMNYYIGSTKPSYRDYHQVQNWIMRNTTSIRDQYRLLIKMRLKYHQTKIIQALRKGR